MTGNVLRRHTALRQIDVSFGSKLNGQGSAREGVRGREREREGARGRKRERERERQRDRERIGWIGWYE